MVQMKPFLNIFHGAVVVLNLSALWYDQMYVDLPFPSKDIEDMPFKARHIFLTMWCIVVQTLYFSISLLNDIYGTDSPAPKKPPTIRRIKDITFSLAFPLAIYVASVFWGMYYINKDLIFPDVIEARYPKWVNHVMHTTIVPFIFVELFAAKRNYPSRRFGLTMMVAFISSYTAWVLYIYNTTGVWVYPFFDILNWAMRAIFFVTSMSIGLVVYVIGERLDRLVAPSSKAYTNGVNGHTKRR